MPLPFLITHVCETHFLQPKHYQNIQNTVDI